jgi:hypothetical protein
MKRRRQICLAIQVLEHGGSPVANGDGVQDKVRFTFLMWTGYAIGMG